MSLLTILKFPDMRLREISVPVKSVTPELVKLSEDMLETMYKANGIGLAAPQVDRRIRLVVIDIQRAKDSEEDDYEIDKEAELTVLEKKIQFPLVLFNPEIIKGEGSTTYEEGCLSVPGYNETVQRHKLIEVEALNVKNKKISFKVDGLLSICIQHELDHLEGKLFIDRISTLKSNLIKSKIKKHGYPKKDKTEAM
jgi:peptide deformylase